MATILTMDATVFVHDRASVIRLLHVVQDIAERISGNLLEVVHHVVLTEAMVLVGVDVGSQARKRDAIALFPLDIIPSEVNLDQFRSPVPVHIQESGCPRAFPNRPVIGSPLR